MATIKASTEIGQEGLQAFYGQVSETYLDKLRWPGVYDIYDEMRRRDPTLRGMMNAVKLLARQSTWRAEPATDGDEDKAAAERLQANLENMSHTVEDLVDDVFTFMPFGWSSFEQVWQRADDGGIEWRKLAFRRQSTLDRWDFDATGGLRGWYQRPAPDYNEIYLPIEKLLHFVGERDGNNPEGLALFESAYEPWYYVKNLQIISGIGWQRSFVGLPTFEFEEKPSSDDKARVQQIGQGLAIDDRQFVSLPPGVKMVLQTVSNANSDGLLNTIKFYRTLMLQMILADFIMLGTTSGTGSWALGTDKSEIFVMAVNGYLDKIAAIWNRHGVARWFEYNPGLTGRAKIAHSEIRKPNLTALSTFISQIAPYIRMADEDQIWIRDQAGMPEIQVEDLEEEETAPAPDDELPPDDDEEMPESEPNEDAETAPEVAASQFFRPGPAWRGYG